MTTRGSYVHKPMVKFSGYPEEEKNLVQISQNIDAWGFRQNSSKGKKLEFIKLCKQNPFEKILIYTIYLIHWL